MAINLPESSKGDALQALAKAGISLLPIAGGHRVELFQYLIQPPLGKRRVAWMDEVGKKLHELEERGLDLTMLQGNEQYITAVVQASVAAIRTHQKAKVDALRNEVVNIALGESADEMLQHPLVGLIDEFTEMHFRLLTFAKAPAPPAGLSMGGLSTVLEGNIPTRRAKNTLYNQF